MLKNNKKFKILYFTVGLTIAGIALYWVLRNFDLQTFLTILEKADVKFLILVPLSLMLQQGIRSWKWKHIISPLRAVSASRLFTAIMAGYFTNMIIPFAASPLVRSWLVGKRYDLPMGTVLATSAIERFIDGLIFSLMVAFTLAFAALPDPDGNIRTSLMLGSFGGGILFSGLIGLLLVLRRKQPRSHPLASKLINKLPDKISHAIYAFARSFPAGIVWPRQPWRWVAIITAGFLQKAAAATHFLWAGLAFGIVLAPLDYIYIVVLLGLLGFINHLLRIPGGYFIGNLYILGLFGLSEEQSLALALTVHASTLFVFIAVGGLSLWQNGVALRDLKNVSRASPANQEQIP